MKMILMVALVLAATDVLAAIAYLQSCRIETSVVTHMPVYVGTYYYGGGMTVQTFPMSAGYCQQQITVY